MAGRCRLTSGCRPSRRRGHALKQHLPVRYGVACFIDYASPYDCIRHEAEKGIEHGCLCGEHNT